MPLARCDLAMGSGTMSAAAVCVSDRYDDGGYSGGFIGSLAHERALVAGWD